jgi:hemolysin III
VQEEYDAILASFAKSCVSPLVVAPMMHNTANTECIIGEYIAACQFYGCDTNPGVLTAFRFSLPSLRVTANFHDADVLALAQVMIPRGNTTLKYIQRLDFTIAAKLGKVHGKRGFGSHGAFALAKIMQACDHVTDVRLSNHKVGPFGASAIFMAASQHPSLRTLQMRHCRIMERGGLAFAELVCQSQDCQLEEVDLSCNHIGLRGCIGIEQELSRRCEKGANDILVDLESNQVFQEIMNGVTHGLGIILAVVGSTLLSDQVKDLSTTHVRSCAVYSTSLLVLYTSSTLFHSFFSLQNTKYIFEVLDKCAIYILIAGSYTPFLQIVLGHEKLWSTYLLAFIWVCCLCGVTVEAFFPIWKHKALFSLAMYLGMGWSCVVCLPELVDILPSEAMNLLVLGGVGYTCGVPFFVRNHNLDHTIFHLFVLSGSIFHWLGIYWYLPLIGPPKV